MSDNTATIVLTTDDATAAALVATIKGAVNGARKYSDYVEAHSVTHDTVKDHARALAVLAYPKDEPVQKKDGARTRFGNAVQAAGKGLRTALGPNPNVAPRTQNLLTPDGVKRLVSMLADGAEDQIIAAVMEELIARASA